MPDQTHLQGEHTKSNDDLKLTVHIRADVAPGTQLKLTLEKLPDDFAEPEAHNFPRNKLAVEIIPWLKTVSRIVAKIPFVRANVILGFALTIYLITRLVGLQYFPIYFFTDEAVQTVQAADLWYNNLFSAEGEFLPTYFYNGYQYNLCLLYTSDAADE